MARTDTIQGRFKHWRQETERSLREVREAVNAHLPEDRRVSVATVSNYETAAMAPPRSDFVAALKVAYPDLNVGWLLTGEGEMTVTEDRAAGQEVRELLFNAAPRLVGRGGGPARALLADLLRRLVAASPEDEALTEEQVTRIGRHVERLAFAGLNAFHPPTRSRGSFTADADALTAALHALTLAVPDRGQGRTLEELLTSMEDGGRRD